MIAWLLLVALGVGTARGGGPEYDVKAEVLDRVVRFVEWPPTAFAAPAAPFVWCVVGDDPFGGRLETMTLGRAYAGRAAVVRHLRGAEGVEACHLVFVASTASSRLAGVLARTDGKPVLVAGDTPGFAASGALVNLYVEGAHVGFEVNVDAVRRSGLVFSGKLLYLARVVRD